MDILKSQPLVNYVAGLFPEGEAAGVWRYLIHLHLAPILKKE